VAERNFGFYSSGEFEVDQLIAEHHRTRFLEVGRARIADTHRGRRVFELPRRGLWAYARQHNMDAMIGCVSLHGRPCRSRSGDSLPGGTGGDPSWCAAPRVECAAVLPDSGSTAAPGARRVIRALRPLVKGYLRLGATFSPEPAIDPVFGATDLFVVLPLHEVEARYLRHCDVAASSAAARSVTAGNSLLVWIRL
jgi:L-ornithine Nalpha-acyltransferase